MANLQAGGVPEALALSLSLKAKENQAAMCSPLCTLGFDGYWNNVRLS